MNKITIYGREGCVWCDRAKSLCERKGYDHEYIDLTSNLGLWNQLVAMYGFKTVPQVFVGTKHVGGFSELAAADKDNSLQQIIGGQ